MLRGSGRGAAGVRTGFSEERVLQGDLKGEWEDRTGRGNSVHQGWETGGQGRVGKPSIIVSQEHQYPKGWTVREEGEGQWRQEPDLETLLCPAKGLRGQHLGDGEPSKGHDMMLHG